MFSYDDAKILEWHKFLKEYSAKEVGNNFDKYILEYHDRPPLFYELTRNLEKITPTEEKEVYIGCELCGKRILVGNDWREFEEHHRRCAKIDFIDRQSKEIRGEGIDKQHFREMSDEELDKKYYKIMNNWEETHPNLNVKNIFKKVEEEA
jgi:hypothetical protein